MDCTTTAIDGYRDVPGQNHASKPELSEYDLEVAQKFTERLTPNDVDLLCEEFEDGLRVGGHREYALTASGMEDKSNKDFLLDCWDWCECDSFLALKELAEAGKPRRHDPYTRIRPLWHGDILELNWSHFETVEEVRRNPGLVFIIDPGPNVRPGSPVEESGPIRWTCQDVEPREGICSLDEPGETFCYLFWDFKEYKSDLDRCEAVARERHWGSQTVIWLGAPDDAKIPDGSVAPEQNFEQRYAKWKEGLPRKSVIHGEIGDGEREPVLANYIEVPKGGMAQDGEDDTEKLPLQSADIAQNIFLLTNGWPKRIAGRLFQVDGGKPYFFEKVDQLFGWLTSFGRIDWKQSTGFVKRNEIFHYLEHRADDYSSIEQLPHEPPLKDVYYIDFKLPQSDGSALTKFVNFFQPETTVDKELIKATIVTGVWGGRPGSKPAIAITADAGRGTGKSRCAQAIAELFGGGFDIAKGENIETIKTRLLSNDAVGKRIGMIDNIKSHRFSWAEFESLITCSTISGKRLYVGEGSRLNTLLWMLTLNAPALSRDIAQRSVIIKLAPSDNRPGWWEEVLSFIEQNRAAIIADCIALLRSRPTCSLTQHTRWAAWEAAIVSRLDNPLDIQKLIAERQAECDADEDEANMIEDAFASKLETLGFDHERVFVQIPSKVVCDWYCEATREKISAQGVTRRLKQAATEGRIHCLQPDKSRTNGRCFIWTGQHCDHRQTIVDSKQFMYQLANARKDEDA